MPVAPSQSLEFQTSILIPDVDESGDDYQHWVIQRSFDLVWPIGLAAFVLTFVYLVIVDPSFYAMGMWARDVRYIHLALWHVATAGFLAIVLVAFRRTHSHSGRTHLLIAFLVGMNALAVWFSYISWHLTGDLSMYAIVLLTSAAVFVFPGRLRQIIALVGASMLGIAIAVFDQRGSFITSGVFLNLIAMVVIAMFMDQYVRHNSKALFHEKCRADAEKCRADQVLYNALPVSIANELKTNKTVKAEKFQRMTVLFADIVGFTKFSASLPPDAVILVLNQIFSEFDSLVDAYVVEKIKTIGDAYMVVGKGNAQQVADLAFEMIAKIAAYNKLNGVNLELRFGMHVGPTVAGVIGLKRFLYDVWGDAVNTASRLETTGAPGKIHVSEAIADELKEDFLLEDRGQIELKGKGLVRTYFLLSRKRT